MRKILSFGVHMKFFLPSQQPHTFTLKNGLKATLSLVKDPKQIDQDAARSVLVESFITEYEKYLQPNQISKDLTYWRDGENSVKKYYEDYFTTEMSDFTEGKLQYWVEVKAEIIIADKVFNRLIGWATFEREKNRDNEVYMNLLIVHPDYQKQGVGAQLVHALTILKEISSLNGINILLRNLNQGGKIFYESLGFKADPEYERDNNFVDMNLLSPFTWKNPELHNQKTLSASE